MKTGHFSLQQGKRVKVFKRDGSSFIDKFLGHKSGVVLLEKAGRVKTAILRTLTIYKGKFIS
jgi:hypothetical protein